MAHFQRAGRPQKPKPPNNAAQTGGTDFDRHRWLERVKNLGLAGPIKPVKEHASPDDAILRREHPMPLLGKVQETTRNTLHLSRCKGLHALRDGNTKVFLPMNDQQWSFPISDK